MRAVAFTGFGSPPVVTDLPAPTVAPGEVLLRVRASSVNGFDFGVLGGFLKGTYEYEFPVILGKDVAGEVVAVGDGISNWAVGDSVFGVIMRPTLGQGGFAEYVAVPAGYGIARIPDGLDFEQAGALGLAGTAALNAIDAIAPEDGETILISGATGGVGAYAIQMARARGATVIATAHPGAQAQLVKDLGAAIVVDRSDVSAQVRTVAPTGVAGALHLAGDGREVASLVADGGRFASTVHFTPDDDRDLRASVILADPGQHTLNGLAGDVVAGHLRVPLTVSYPLAETLTALADFSRGTVGKIGVTM
ncbi:NADP-dependent oxidoreductase [Yinghuangia aomiensis]|uniref:NADP-dependent oxidoreductase n=1 Tax=Yinghuangia aomiensis TaxID=676205 RepID=A0ABP9ICQ1_9ACTN